MPTYRPATSPSSRAIVWREPSTSPCVIDVGSVQTSGSPGLLVAAEKTHWAAASTHETLGTVTDGAANGVRGSPSWKRDHTSAAAPMATTKRRTIAGVDHRPAR